MEPQGPQGEPKKVPKCGLKRDLKTPNAEKNEQVKFNENHCFYYGFSTSEHPVLV